MKSFTKKLVLNCTGVIFISFLVVYFLFNVLVSSYIRAEAERELSGGMTDVVSLTYAFPSFGLIHVPENIFTMESSDAWVAAGTDVVSPSIGIRIGEFRDVEPFTNIGGRFEIELRQRMVTMPNIHWSFTEPPIPVREGEMTVEGIFTTLRPVRQHSFVNTDVIVIDDQNEIITPLLDFLPASQRAEVEFLVGYYLSNQSRFNANNDMVRVAGANRTYYLSTVSQALNDGTFSILMYTDISSAMVFTNSMNRILGLLLAVSGLLSLVISIAMSTKFKRAIVRLCNYAETIGRGKFNESAGSFNDAEFNQLAKSMDNMSNMLQAYENNQKQFFQNASHELRTPLMSIQGYAEGILKDIFSKEEAVGVILLEGQKMAGLVDELLYVSRMDSNTEVVVSALDVKELLYECCERVKPIAQQAGKQVTLQPLPQEIFVNADEEKLERAIMNVLSNAVRHASSDVGVKYNVVGDNVEIVVEDDGDGVSSEDMPHIFERFYKGENGNYGLGLAISKDIIRNLGGGIVAGNRLLPEMGAVFTVTLPVGVCRG